MAHILMFFKYWNSEKEKHVSHHFNKYLAQLKFFFFFLRFYLFFAFYFSFSPKPPSAQLYILVVGPSSYGMGDATSAWLDEQC